MKPKTIIIISAIMILISISMLVLVLVKDGFGTAGILMLITQLAFSSLMTYNIVWTARRLKQIKNTKE